jgi:hypothetical protein
MPTSDWFFKAHGLVPVTKTAAFEAEPRQMLKILRRYDIHCSFHLQGECVMVGRCWQPYRGQAVRGELHLVVVVGAGESYLRQAKATNHYTFTLNMETAVYVVTPDNFQHLTPLGPEIRNCTLIPSPLCAILVTHSVMA